MIQLNKYIYFKLQQQTQVCFIILNFIIYSSQKIQLKYNNYQKNKQIQFLKNRRAYEEFVIKQLQQNEDLTEDNYYLSITWARDYTTYLQDNKPSPGPFDNQCLLIGNYNLKQNIILQQHYVLISSSIMYIIYNLYGGGPIIKQQNQITQSLTQHANSDSEQKQQQHFQNRSLYKYSIQPIGLQNTSNYCYMNSCIQCLFSIEQLNKYFYQKDYMKSSSEYKYKKKFQFCLDYNSLLKQFNQKTLDLNQQSQYINPIEFKKNSKNKFNPSEQHDAQEYLLFVLGEIQDELNYVLPQKYPTEFKDSQSAYDFYIQYHPSIVDQLFCGQLISEVQCNKCEHVSCAYDPFLDLSLSIDDKNLQNIDQCLENFFKAEQIDGNYKCEKCNKISKPQKKIRIGKTPQILVLHLKRFKMFPYKKKINSNISYSHILDIKRYCSLQNNQNQVNYKLFSIISHSGGVEYGHYVSFNKRKDKWYFCDDENIKKLLAVIGTMKFKYQESKGYIGDLIPEDKKQQKDQNDKLQTLVDQIDYAALDKFFFPFYGFHVICAGLLIFHVNFKI
ncbi:ubiquitin carboxyl-terminal hydrolase family protein, putative [Ichthyophthirius multifiliis]|uniref:Ubiquitin carboxyl-terminal hydrolase family protein, putative n=1 Tax=Ichthyophthirius multifiliis TaxID=5932 RepID=G0R467_ICHMU|nr:ubiquitin carboxyl-terminal hydrolase family protein, putative [Ichthyophthirius multifiliis]EGR27738.1 ubiquitin carboxyl-terminal hydrolase family protein, putative [Ichthyophthirius multifiliis]|eukprot:XP_004025190.1 ubiquitin carboxyl-terminal hydrolase family protein, putative [Ichthyophthirius multifiliis]